MKYISTRGKTPPMRFSEALRSGNALDGGLYVPEKFPLFDFEDFPQGASLAEVAARLIPPWLEGDPLAKDLPEICRAAFNFPIPLEFVEENTAILELFHGPTGSFKDFGARFLSQCWSRLPKGSSQKKQTVLVATSGDTGGAVAGAFFGVPGIEVVILFPKGKVSARQEKQLTAWGGNVRALAVRGTFDDCQAMVKAALHDVDMRSHRDFLAANSINIGRLLPQTVYYAWASLNYLRGRGEVPGMIIPTGNLGNSVAALWAKKMGFPIREVVLATNANRAIPDYFASGEWKPHSTVSTLANAMDVGNPSNVERLIQLYPRIDDLRRDVRAVSVSDIEISTTIVESFRKWKRALCPHTATAAFARKSLVGDHWILAATAHPAKFENIVEPLIGRPLDIPLALGHLLSQPSQITEIRTGLQELRKAI